MSRAATLVFSLTFLVCAALVGNSGAATSPADDRYWPQWRGPQFTGVSPTADPPVEWSETSNVAWKTEIPGSGFATPVIWADQVFVLSAVVAGDPASLPAVGGGQQQRRGRRRAGPLAPIDFIVMAIDRNDGSVSWSKVARREQPHEGKQGNNSWASSSAITDGEHVFAFFGSRGLYAYDMSGNELWDVDFGEMEVRGGFGEGATPVLHGDTLIVVWDHQGESFIAALNKNTGEEIWRQPRDEPDTWATPLVVEGPQGTQVITAGQNRTYGYDFTSGELIWEGPGLTVNPIPSPVESDGIVYLTSGYRGNAMRAVRLADATGNIDGSPAILWEYNQDTPYVSSPLLYGGRIFFLKSNSPILTAVDISSGNVTYGPARLEGLQEVYASPVGAAGRIYIVGRDGTALVIGNGDRLDILATNSLDDGFEASPAIAGDEIYLRGRRFLYKIALPR